MQEESTMQTKNQIYLFLIGCFISFFLIPQSISAASLQETVARVNNTTITRQDVTREISIIETERQLLNLSWQPEQLNSLSEQVKDTLIKRELLFQRAQQRQIEIRPQWIQRTLMDLRSRIGSKSAFKAYLRDTGLTEHQLKKRIHKGLIIQRLLHQEVLRSIKVSEAEMQAFFKQQPDLFVHQDQIRVRQIFIATGKNDTAKREKALMRIQSIQKRLERGANFTVMALEYSEDTSRSKGGDLGYLERTQLIPSFADAAFALHPGEISDIVETPIGYHLIKLVDYVPSARMAYHNARSQIEHSIRYTKENSAAIAYLSKLEKEAIIVR